MSTKQTWRINGQTYNHAQLMEMKKQGLDPRKDKIVMKFLKEDSEPEKKKDEPKVKEEPKTPEKEDLPTNFMQLKKLARDKGMEVTEKTTKAEVLEFLK